jgi:hypothetical protein
MRKKTTRKTKTTTAALETLTFWDFYLSGGDWFARLTFQDAKTVRKLFPGAKIDGNAVYLA